MARARIMIVALLTAVTALTGCGDPDTQSGQAPTAVASTSAPPATSSPEPEPVYAPCVEAGQGRHLPGAVDGALIGRGARGVVFLNTADGSACDWVPFARELAAEGWVSAVWDYGAGDGLAARRREVAAVTTAVRQAGAEQVVMVGGSRGGCLGLISATAKETSVEVTGVAVLSCARVWNREDPVPLADHLPRVDVPVLEVVARQDPDVPVAEVRQDVAALAEADLVTVPGSDHGTALLSTPTVRRAVEQFLRDVTR